MIDFYYIISQKPFYKSQPDSFIGRKRRFCFYSRDPSLTITELSRFDSGPVAMGRHFSKRILVLPPSGGPLMTQIVQLSQRLMSHRFASEEEAEKNQMRVCQGEGTGPFIPVVGHPDGKEQR